MILRTLGMFLLALFGVASLQADEVPALRVWQIVAHRGSSADRPENTEASTRRAIEVGATAVEVDVRTTKDGELVLSHDASVDRMTNGRGLINDKTLAEIQQLDAGSKFDPKFASERIPTLAQVLTLCRDKIDVLLDLKEMGDDYDRKVVAAVKAHGDPKRVIVGARSVDQAKRFRQLLPQARQLGLIEKPEEIEIYAAAGVEMIRLWPKWLTDKSLVDRVRRSGVKLHLNGSTGTLEEIVPLLSHRPDSLSSDDPAKLLETLHQLRKNK